MDSKIYSKFNEDEIDIRQIWQRLAFRKKLILSISIFSLLLSTAYSFYKKPKWEGQFQIVLSNKESSRENIGSAIINSNPILSNLVNNKNTQNLNTEVEILKSPSVLMPVFNFVTQTNNKLSIKNYSSFRKWKKSQLNVELEKGTSVLNIAYKDTNKNLIIPVLENISSQYQLYSGRERSRSINQGINYLNKQISIYKERTLASRRNAINFSIQNDIPIIETNNLENNSSKFDINTLRIKASNEIRKIDRQLAKIRVINNENEILQFSNFIYQGEDNKLIEEINNINSRLSLMKDKYVNDDYEIKLLKRERSNLTNLLKENTIGYLNAQKIKSSSIEDASFRPSKVLIRSKELLREVAKEEETLKKLESELRILSLEKARNMEPWELITKPTLIEESVSLGKKQLISLGLIFGTMIGAALAIFLERKRIVIYNIEELETILNSEIIEVLSLNSDYEWEQSLKLLSKNLISKESKESTAIVPVGNLNKNNLEKFRKDIKKYFSQKEIIINNDLLLSEHCSRKILLTSLGKATKDEIIQFKKRIDLQDNYLLGILIL